MMALDQDCTDALALITAYQHSLRAAGKPIEPRLIAWGLRVLERRGANLQHIKRGWGEMTPEQRWRRVRAHLPGTALNTLAGLLSAEFGSPYQQLSLGITNEKSVNDL